MSSSRCQPRDTTGGLLACALVPGRVFRVGFPPDPWAWAGWEYARSDGRFGGRWDDANGEFRTVYAASTMLGCLLEVLAPLRPDPVLSGELDAIAEDEQDARDHPTVAAGTLSPTWIASRRAGTAHLNGTYCCVTEAQSVATVRSQFLTLATVQLGLPDLDAAALRLAQPRELTQRVASWLWEQTVQGDRSLDGVRFLSRHGDEHELWAVFERDEDGNVSRRITHAELVDLNGHPALAEAMRIHGLHRA